MLAGRDELRDDSNLGPEPETAARELSRSAKRQMGRSGASAYSSSHGRERGFDGLSDDDDEEDLEQLELQLRLAKLRKKKGLGKMGAAKDSGEGEEAWF